MNTDMNPLLKDIPILTPEEQASLIQQYIDGDKEAGGKIVHANARYIQNILCKLKMPCFISRDDLFADVMPDVLSGLKSFDITKSSLKTFLYLVVSRSAIKASRQYEAPYDGDVSDIQSPDREACDVVGLIRNLVAAVPDEEINETGRKLISRMLRGYDMEEIASQMGWGVAETKQMVEQQRLLIAWLMKKAGHSADPWIDDKTLGAMADRYARQREGWWR